MVCVEHEGSASEIDIEMVHPPQSSLHFQEEWCVVGLVLLQLATGVRNDAVFPFLVDLRQDGPQPPGLLIDAKTGIRDEGIRSVSSRVSHHWLGAKVGLELFKGCQSQWRQSSSLPLAIFPGQHCQRCGQLCEVSDVRAEEVAQPEKLTDFMHRSRRSGFGDGL